MKALFVDFEDSFSYNVVQELVEAKIDVRVIHWRDFLGTESEDLLVFGPGPGHPREYQEIFKKLYFWLERKKYFLGICLGHQIFWSMSGAEVLNSKTPIHGQKIKLILDDEWRAFFELRSDPWVQRYNSLCVPQKFSSLKQELKHFIQEDEILISRGERILTYQFHPESVGTNYPKAFFRPLIRDFV